MIIRKLQVENLRNLSRVDIAPHESLNYLYGDNGAGKTSLLESMVVLSRGRSFKTNLASELIGPRGSTFRVFAIAEDPEGQTCKLGLERSGKRWRGRLNGNDLSQLSQLTKELPMVMMEPDSHLLVSGAPEVRRKYLDWGMFHVKHSFLDTWRRFSRALKQRNAALRRSQENLLDSLDEVLSEEGEALGEMRKAHAAAISENIGSVLNELTTRIPRVDFTYNEGWNVTKSYSESLFEHRSRDLERGTTTTGPHRADLLFRCARLPARAVLSRGEQKLFAAALILTQARILAAAGEKPVILFDDLVSEFDQDHFQRVLSGALALDLQVWVTGTERVSLKQEHCMFHVEQGSIAKVV